VDYFGALMSRLNKELFLRRHKDIADRFHILYYDEMRGKTWSDTRWMGVQILKNPMDLWVYQETIFELKPDIIIECGSAYGGGALFFASLFDLMGHGEVVSIDVSLNPLRPFHKRVTYLEGSSTSDEVVSKAEELAEGKGRVFVVLDSDHHKGHVLKEMERYSHLVTVGSYMVVEDTNINGHPVHPSYGEGPMEAVEEFLRTRHDFVRDSSKEKFYMTFFPGGWLKRV